MLALLALAVTLAQAATPSPSPTASPAPSPSASPTPVPMRRVASSALAVPVTWQSAEQPHQPGYVPLGAWGDAGSGEEIALSYAANFGRDAGTLAAQWRKGLAQAFSYVSGGPVPLCHGGRGWQDRFAGTNGAGYTFVYGTTPSRVYVATFTYPGYPGPSAAGQSAALSLCPPADPVVHAGPPPIAPPAGWKTAPVARYEPSGKPAETVWSWYADAAKRESQFVEVVTFAMPPGKGGLSYGFAHLIDAMLGDRGHAQVLVRKPATLCGKYDGVYLEMHATLPGRSNEIESYMTVADRRAYVATYSRVLGSAADPAAERAIRSLCP